MPSPGRFQVVSVLFNEPKLLKFKKLFAVRPDYLDSFSALQRAEIAEIIAVALQYQLHVIVSVLFNEPKLLKSYRDLTTLRELEGFSALQRAEIAEIARRIRTGAAVRGFQCSSTSRNC